MKKSVLVIGGIGILMILLLLPALNQAREKARRADCASNMRGIGLLIALYGEMYSNNVPLKLEALTNVTSSTKIFFCSSAKDRTHYSYELTGAINLWQDNPNAIILREKTANHEGKGGNVLYNDGHVQWISATTKR